MHAELAAFLRLMPDEVPMLRAGRRFWVGHLDGHEIVAVLSGVGKVAAATTASVVIGEFGVETLLQHDMDASPLFPRYEVPFYGKGRLSADAAMASALGAAARAVLDAALQRPAGATGDALDATLLASFGVAAPTVHAGLVVSGDRFVASAAENAELRGRLPAALAVEMEGAALAQVCHDFAVPFAVVRTVSDRADDAAHVDFMRFVDAVASRYSLAIVRRFLRDFSA